MSSTNLPADNTEYDLLIIGGGINGAGIARDAAGRGYRVCLVEQGDIGGATSAWSTKLIHGGLRYLEHYEFRLVREALIERERLWALAPHIIRPIRFILPHHKAMRPAWLLRLGLFLYDYMGGRKKLPPTAVVDLSKAPFRDGLAAGFVRGFEYSDAQVDDSRLTLINARDAAQHGATILTRTTAKAIVSDGAQGWRAMIETSDGPGCEIKARMVVNAAGPWADQVLRDCFGQNDAQNLRLVQGSHVIVKQLFDHDRAFIFQQQDGRIVFALPYRHDTTLIGTTDHDVTDPATCTATEAEIAYLLAAINSYLAQPLTADDVLSTYAGVRALYHDGSTKAQETTRDYVLQGDPKTPAPLLNIFGGKLTTYRKLAEAALDLIEHRLGAKGSAWTGQAHLPGGAIDVEGIDQAEAALAARYPFLMADQVTRLIYQFGSEAGDVLGDAATVGDLGDDFGHGLTAREVDWMVSREWARSADDILWRRTKLGLCFTPDQKANLTRYLAANGMTA
ncbi:MAG: glycerol-3-phosphate dehydrogenase [Pseudomonadota bacterium]